MKIGIYGAVQIGGTLARRFSELGHLRLSGQFRATPNPSPALRGRPTRDQYRRVRQPTSPVSLAGSTKGDG